MFTNRVRRPLLFIHNHFLSYMDKTTQKNKKDMSHGLLLTSFSPTPPPPPNFFLVILSISLLFNYYLYNKKLLCHNLSD
jgi:hypothetical protein